MAGLVTIHRAGGFLAMALILMLAAVLAGCSDGDRGSSAGPTLASSASAVEAYFPLCKGYSTVFETVSSGGGKQTLQYEAGKCVPFGNGSAIEFYSFGASSGVDTGFFRVTSKAMYYYANRSAAPVKLLELPLTTGRLWIGSGSALDTSDIGIIVSPGKEPSDDTTQGDPGGNAKFVTPLRSASYYAVDGVGSLELSSGAYYSGVVRIRTDAGAGRYDYLWYAPGIGLIKYTLGAVLGQFDEGSTVGELVYFGYR